MLPGSVIPITVYCQCIGALPVSPLEAMTLKGLDEQDKEECLDDVQFIAAIVARIQAKDLEKKRNKK